MSTEPKDGLDAHERAAGTMYDANAAQPLPERRGAFHAYSPAAEIIRQRGSELFSQTGMSSRDQQQLEETFRNFENVLPDAVVARIADGHVANLLAAAHVPDDPNADDTAMAQQISESNAALREQFIRRYGARDGEALLERTARFVRVHPKLAAILRERGLGSRPDVVEGIAAHVFSSGWR